MNIHKTYVKTAAGFAEYIGGPNFVNGRRMCTDCGFVMIRVPLDQPFKRTKGGKVLVSVNPRSGRLIVNKTDPDYLWKCLRCSSSIHNRNVMA